MTRSRVFKNRLLLLAVPVREHLGSYLQPLSHALSEEAKVQRGCKVRPKALCQRPRGQPQSTFKTLSLLCLKAYLSLVLQYRIWWRSLESEGARSDRPHTHNFNSDVLSTFATHV
jgi:hypothetical protein